MASSNPIFSHRSLSHYYGSFNPCLLDDTIQVNRVCAPPDTKLQVWTLWTISLCFTFSGKFECTKRFFFKVLKLGKQILQNHMLTTCIYIWKSFQHFHKLYPSQSYITRGHYHTIWYHLQHLIILTQTRDFWPQQYNSFKSQPKWPPMAFVQTLYQYFSAMTIFEMDQHRAIMVR